MDTTLKDMPVSLHTTIHTDIMTLAQQFKSEVAEVSQRVSHIKNKMGKFATTFNELVQSHNERDEEMHWIKSKLADLEDRARYNNIKIWGIPKSVKQPDLKLEDLLINRIHRLPKPNIFQAPYPEIP